MDYKDTREGKERYARLESLKLSLSSVLAQLERATHPLYRITLEKGRGALEKDIEDQEHLIKNELLAWNEAQERIAEADRRLYELELQRRADLERIKAEEQKRRETEEQKRREAEEQKRKEQAQRQRALEAESAREFFILKERYLATSHQDRSPSSPLYVILKKIESTEELDSSEVLWLRSHQLHETLTIYYAKQAREYEQRFQISGDPWHAVKASSFWRDAGQPKKALNVTGGLVNRLDTIPPKPKSALLTTRGGAFRDVEDLPAAESCAYAAIAAHETYYPYNLLGGIYYQIGRPAEADEFFLKAIMLGSTPKAQEAEIRNSVERAGTQERKEVAKYLLQKDANKYKWTAYYL